MLRGVFITAILLKWTSGLQIIPETSELIIDTGKSLALMCISDSPTEWSFPSGHLIKTTIETEFSVDNHTKYQHNFTANSIHYLDTGYYECSSKNNVKDAAKIYVYCRDENILAINSKHSALNVEMYSEIVIPCKPTFPEVEVSLRREDTLHHKYNNYDPKVGFTTSTATFANPTIFYCNAFYNGTKSATYKFYINLDPPKDNFSTPYIHIKSTGIFNRSVIIKGKNVTLNCSVVSLLHINIKLEWNYPSYIEGTNITTDDVTQVTYDGYKLLYRILNISNIGINDTGPYKCQVTDQYSNHKIFTESLQIHELSSNFLNVSMKGIQTKLKVEAGEKYVELCAVIWVHPKPNITCYGPEGQMLNTSPQRQSKYTFSWNEGNVSLKINDVAIEDTGVYEIVINNGVHEQTIKYYLTVEERPSVEIQSELNFLQDNSASRHTCFITGYPLPQVTWYKKNCDEFPTCENNTFSYISASEHIETITNVNKLKSVYSSTAQQSTAVQCKANNSLGSDTAFTRHFVSDLVDVFELEKTPDEIYIGDDIQISCYASKHHFTWNFTWYLNNSEEYLCSQYFPGINRTHQKNEDFFQTVILIPNIQKNHSGSYKCRNIWADPQYIEKNISIEVRDIEEPTVKTYFSSNAVRQVSAGQRVNITIDVHGAPPPDVIWSKNGEPLLLNDNIILSNYNTTVSIANMSEAEEGVYSFIVTNKAGNVTDKLRLVIGELSHDDQNNHTVVLIGFLVSIIALLFGIGLVWLAIKMQKQRHLKRMLKDIGLLNFEERAFHNLDPELDIEDQAFLLPYNKAFEFPKENLEFGKVLGSGAFGVVRKAVANGIVVNGMATEVAVKMVKRSTDPMYMKALARELKIMIFLGQHLNVVNLLGACTKNLQKGELAVIVEYCQYGNLRDFLLKHRNNFVNQVKDNGEVDFSITTIRKNENRRYYVNEGQTSSGCFENQTTDGSDGYLIPNDSEPAELTKLTDTVDHKDLPNDYGNFDMNPIKTTDLISWSFQVARGMEYLSSKKILHGDLAARNVLLADKNVAKICDFGLAKDMYQCEHYEKQKNALLPLKWMAIESIRDRVFSIQSDVWSFGITIWEFFSLSVTPYPGIVEMKNLYEMLESGYRMEKPKFATDKIYNMMKICWSHEPASRPSFLELGKQLGNLLEKSVRSHYINLYEAYVNINPDIDNVGYLRSLDSPRPPKPQLYANITDENVPNLNEVEMHVL